MIQPQLYGAVVKTRLNEFY